MDISGDFKYVILEALKGQEGYLSGEDLAKKLGITRQALWKHIAKLQEKGYEIAAVPHLGYQLISCPDKLYPWEIQHKLSTKFMGKDIHHYEIIPSTQDIAVDLGVKGFPEGTLVVSERQTRGRGRLRRNWVSPYGGVYFSLLLRPDFISLEQVSCITLLAGLGCIYGIKRSINISGFLKWPNDIFLNGKKLGGILCEVDAEADRVNSVVVGIGINVNPVRDNGGYSVGDKISNGVNTLEKLPPYATSLFRETGKRVNRVELLKKILEEIERLYFLLEKEGFSLIRQEWQEFCFLRGERVRVKTLNREIEGEAAGIDEKGHLVLKTGAGRIEKISAGDVEKLG